jgi:hypothetical protein
MYGLQTEGRAMKLTLHYIAPQDYTKGSYGLEQWHIRLNGTLVHTFLCERHARTRFEKLKQKLGTK